MATPNYDVDYNDKRFTAVTNEEKNELNEWNGTFDKMASDAEGYYNDLAGNAQKWADKQTEIQDERYDYTIKQINQQKDQAKQDYIKEQSGAYVDWQKQSNQYGANAEKMAAQGLAGTGYSESSQVSMYNTYQNRVATARESYDRAVLNYNNAIKDATLQNSSVLAEIAYEALQKQLELSLQGFQYKNELIMKKADKEAQIKSFYWQKYQDVLKQINTENALAEEVRQYDESMKFQREQFNYQIEQDAKESDTPKITKYTNSQINARNANREKSSGSSSTKITKYSESQKNARAKEREKDPTVDMDSVLDLGFGPISESKLNDLVESGVVEEYVSGNKIKFRLSANAVKQKQVYYYGG